MLFENCKIVFWIMKIFCVFPAEENSLMREKTTRIAIKKTIFNQFLSLQVKVICFTPTIKSDVAEEHHLVAIYHYCVMLTQ